MTQRPTLPTTGLRLGDSVLIEFRPASGDYTKQCEVTAVYEGGTVLADGKVFRADGSERCLGRWGARIVGRV